MKTKMVGILGLLAISVKAQPSNTTYIFSADIAKNGNITGKVYGNPVKPRIDLNGDNQFEQIYVITKIGGSQNGNTLDIKSVLGMRQLLKVDFSSVGGTAIGNFIPGQKEKQVAVWDYWQDRNAGESHTSPHRYRVTVYKWNPVGNQEMVPMLYFLTTKKYPFVANSKKPLQEFMSSRTLAIYRANTQHLVAHNVSANDLKEILASCTKWGNYKTAIGHSRQVGQWVIGSRYIVSPKNPRHEGETLVWRKVNSKWIVIKSGSDLPDDNDTEINRQIGKPGIWPKLRKAYLDDIL